MTETYFDELAVSFAEASPFFTEGRRRLQEGLRRAFRDQATKLANQVDSVSLPQEDTVVWSPQDIGVALAEVRVRWDDAEGASLDASAMTDGNALAANLLGVDAALLASELARVIPDAPVQLEVTVEDFGRHLGDALAQLIEGMDEGLLPLVGEHGSIGARTDRDRLPVLFTGRAPEANGGGVALGVAGAIERLGMVLDLRFVDTKAASPVVTVDDVPLLIINGAEGPPLWAVRGNDALVQRAVAGGGLVVVIGDWIDGAAWNEAGALLDLLPVSVIGDTYRRGKWNEKGRISFEALRAAETKPLDLSFLVGADATVGGAVRCIPKDDATVLLEVERKDGTRHPFAAYREHSGAACLWLASGTGGWGKAWSQSGRSWEKLWDAILEFAMNRTSR